MSDPAGEQQPAKLPEDDELEPRGINLMLVYSLLALALLAAILFAIFVVWPFYIRR